MSHAYVIIGQTALASSEFLLQDLPGTSGRLDLLVRCIRAALLTSHGIRRDTVIYLVLLGGDRAPRTVRIEGARGRFVRPDERNLAALLSKALARPDGEGFVEEKPGVFVAKGGVEVVLAEVGSATMWMLEEGAPDLRGELAAGDHMFFLGDHHGFSSEVRDLLVSHGVRRISVGPVSLHTEDVVTIVTNELDRLSPRLER